MELIESKLWEITQVLKASVCEDNSLLIGHTGIAMFLAYVNQLYEDPDLSSEMEKSLQKSLTIFQKTGAAHSFCSGYAGVCWGVNHLVKESKLDADIDSLFEEIEPYLAVASENDFQIHLFDFLHGGIGTGIYFLERLPHPFAEKQLKKMVNYLKSQIDECEKGIRWQNSFKTPHAAKDHNEFNLGLAHGIPSILCFLSKCYTKNIEREICQVLVENSVRWIMEQKLKPGSLSLYPTTVCDDKDSEASSRLAWCYGDLGIATAIWQAGCALGREAWKEEALNIMLHASNRKNLLENNVVDACVCHGAAGIAQFFNRFYWETKNPIFKEASNFWIEQTLKMARFKDGVAGFKVWRGNEDGWANDYGLLEGITGIGLALFSHISDEEPTWDRCLLLS